MSEEQLNQTENETPNEELSEEALNDVSGGIIAVLKPGQVSSLNFTAPSSPTISPELNFGIKGE